MMILFCLGIVGSKTIGNEQQEVMILVIVVVAVVIAAVF